MPLFYYLHRPNRYKHNMPGKVIDFYISFGVWGWLCVWERVVVFWLDGKFLWLPFLLFKQEIGHKLGYEIGAEIMAFRGDGEGLAPFKWALDIRWLRKQELGITNCTPKVLFLTFGVLLFCGKEGNSFNEEVVERYIILGASFLALWMPPAK